MIETEKPVPNPSASSPTAGMAVLGLGAGAVALDTSLNVAFPAISAALQLPVAAIQWVIVSYMLVFGALMLVCGRLGDSIGHLAVFRGGLVINAVAFLIATFAPGIETLVPARMLQGAGAAACISCAPALATFLYPETQRMRALAIFGALFAIGQALGPAIGGPLVEAFGWRSVFAYRIPLVLAALLLSPYLHRRPHATRPFQAGAAVLLCVAVASLLAGLNSLQWPQMRLLSLFAFLTGAAALALFARMQRKTGANFLPRSAFAATPLMAINLLNVTINTTAFAVLLLVPYALAARGLDVISLGLVLAVSAMATSAASHFAPACARLLGRDTLLPLGLALCAAGLLAVAMWRDDTSLLACILGLAVQGSGLGLFTVAYTDTVAGSLPVSDRGLAGGIITATRTFGVVAGASLFSGIVRAVTETQPFAAAFAISFQLAAGLLVGASLVLLAWYWMGQTHRQRDDGP